MAEGLLSPVLYAACVTPLSDPQLYRAAYAAASPDRQRKTDRFRFPKDRCLSLGAELLLRHALHRAGAGNTPLGFTYDPQGKPRLAGSRLHFSLSHAGEWVLCALASCEVGCDIEQIASFDLRIAERFFSPEETADIAAQPSARQSELFFRYWTLKESFMKVTGLGAELPPDAFTILRTQPLSVRQTVDHRVYRFSEFEDIPGYKCALCTADCREAPTFVTADLAQILSGR